MDPISHEYEKNNSFCIGIDLGTTQSSIAQLLPQGTIRIFAPDNSCSDKLSISSSVLIQPENTDSYHLYICDDFEQANSRLLLQNTKFLLGSHEDQVKYMDLEFLFPKQQIVSRPNGSIAVIAKEKKQLFRFKKPRPQFLVTPEQVAEKILQTLLQQALSQVPEMQRLLPWNIALCVPVRYSSKQRAIIKEVLFNTASKLHQGGSKDIQVELVDEPVAAAMSFFYEPEYSIYKQDGAVVLVIDCGGGTTDVAIVTYTNDSYTVLACDGDNYLGGRNVDEQLVKHFQREFGGKLNIQKLKYKCERIKRTFSQGASTAVIKMKGVEKEISREMFQKIAGQFNAKVTHVLRSVLRQLAKSLESKKKKEDNHSKQYTPPFEEVLRILDCVVLVGGTSNLIHFQESIEKFLKALAKREIPCFKLQQPELSVVKGAAIKASGAKVCSRTPVALGFELWNGTMHTVLPLGVTLPASKTVTIRPTRSGDVILRILQGQLSKAEENCYLGDLVIRRELVNTQSKWPVRFTMTLDMILQVELEADTERKVLKLSMAKSCGKPLFVGGSVDIVFVVDTTGSMQRSIEQCLETIECMIHREADTRIQHGSQDSLRVGFVAYRDHDIGSEFVTNAFPLTENLTSLTKWIKTLDAKGGHDAAEAVVDGLFEAAEYDWRPDAIKLLFLIADAPPHGKQYHIKGMKNSDIYPSGCPCGMKEENVLKVLAEKGGFQHILNNVEGVQFHAIKVKKRGFEDNMAYLDRMVDVFKKNIEVQSHELEKNMHLSGFVTSAIDVVSCNQEEDT